MGKRLNKKTKFSVTVDLAQCGFGSGELVLQMSIIHPKVLSAPLGSYVKKVRIDLTKVINETVAS